MCTGVEVGPMEQYNCCKKPALGFPGMVGDHMDTQVPDACFG